MRSRYQTMKHSTEVQDSESGEFYRDVMTFPIEQFSYTQTAVAYDLNQGDIHRIDSTMNRYYGTPEFDDIVLWLNDVPFIWDTEVGTTVELPRRRDIERFFTRNTV